MAICVCTYNRGRRILRTLEAIAAMDRAGGRVTGLVVVDNNSNDETGSVVDEFARCSGGLPVRRVVEMQQGIAFARARAFRETEGQLVAFLDDDVVPERDWAARMLGVFDVHERAAMVGGRLELEFETGPTPMADRHRSMLASQELGEERHRLDEPESGLVTAAVVLRREAVEATGWLDERILGGRTGKALTSGEDTELSIRLRLAGWEVWYEPGARARHLIPPDRQTLDYLCSLAHGVSLAKASLKWLAHGRPDAAWAEGNLTKARRKLLRTKALEWRPAVRRFKLAEHRGRVEGWERLVKSLRSNAPA